MIAYSRKSQKQHGSLTRYEDLKSALKVDVVRATDDPNRCSDTDCGVWAIYSLLGSRQQFHFCRQEPNDYWTGKDGSLPPTACDAAGRLITDPEKARQTAYELFCDDAGCECRWEDYPLGVYNLKGCGYHRVCKDTLDLLANDT